ncbi:Hypothetical protein, putative [Bodo saltans]|uniref:Uncharacterized protein n=1 Tax=Bodo saltans TaxID=75058 RepID=A0A0S4J222_BODSA|nr:Hypothetical protein, putative [Bodo saltans]|eukprot:CUG57652.1 Hypothetical protein, putative [Bodo saltans]
MLATDVQRPLKIHTMTTGDGILCHSFEGYPHSLLDGQLAVLEAAQIRLQHEQVRSFAPQPHPCDQSCPWCSACNWHHKFLIRLGNQCLRQTAHRKTVSEFRGKKI